MTTSVVPAHEADAERRHEHRFQVTESIARLVMRTTANNLPLSRDDRPYQWSTTTYCDTINWSIFRAAEKGSAMQLRIREYHRTRPQDVLNPGTAWIELKDDEEDTSLKERFGVPMDVARSFLRGEAALPDFHHGLAERAARLLKAGARPVVVTQYNRLAYNSLDSSIRITADHNLMYFALPWETRDENDEPSPLGSLLSMEPNVIVEMKWYGELPHWAVDLHAYLRENTREERPSKFIVAMRWLLGEANEAKKK
ncbi:MAG TPA: VTC domain-containing protein [Candidatus Limnocylindria bacterium]|nr:VTC domain-containing protein [Candidatus Limnocylindria bacterium]